MRQRSYGSCCMTHKARSVLVRETGSCSCWAHAMCSARCAPAGHCRPRLVQESRCGAAHRLPLATPLACCTALSRVLCAPRHQRSLLLPLSDPIVCAGAHARPPLHTQADRQPTSNRASLWWWSRAYVRGNQLVLCEQCCAAARAVRNQSIAAPLYLAASLLATTPSFPRQGPAASSYALKHHACNVCCCLPLPHVHVHDVAWTKAHTRISIDGGVRAAHQLHLGSLVTIMPCEF